VTCVRKRIIIVQNVAVGFKILWITPLDAPRDGKQVYQIQTTIRQLVWHVITWTRKLCWGGVHSQSHSAAVITTNLCSALSLGWRRGVVVSGVRQWTKLTHVGPGYNCDGWPSSAGYTISGCNQPTRSTQPCIPPGSLTRVPASAGVKAGMSPLPGGR